MGRIFRKRGRRRRKTSGYCDCVLKGKTLYSLDLKKPFVSSTFSPPHWLKVLGPTHYEWGFLKRSAKANLFSLKSELPQAFHAGGRMLMYHNTVITCPGASLPFVFRLWLPSAMEDGKHAKVTDNSEEPCHGSLKIFRKFLAVLFLTTECPRCTQERHPTPLLSQFSYLQESWQTDEPNSWRPFWLPLKQCKVNDKVIYTWS